MIASATLSEEGREEDPVQEVAKRGRPLKQLGKVHLTKQMIKERELFLGVTTKANRGRINAKELPSNNVTLQQAWNTAGFFPVTISSAGQKNSVKDFEYLKFLNDTILKDEVLDKFMQKAGEIE